MASQITSSTYQKNLNDSYGTEEYILVSKITKISDRVSVTHSKCGKTFEVYANDLTKKAKIHRYSETCPACRKDRRTPLSRLNEKLKAVTGDRLEIVRLGKNIHARSEFKCKVCGHVWETPYKSLIQNVERNSTDAFGCPCCSGKKRKTTEDFAEEVQSISNGKLSLVSKYINVKTRVEILCHQCNETYSTTASSILRGSRCPLCNMRYKESRQIEQIEDVIRQSGIPYKREMSFDECRFVRLLYFDFCIMPESGGCGLIEFDGQQHFRGWNGDLENKSKSVARDAKKDEFCLKYNVPLLRLNYKMGDPEIRKRVSEFLSSL